MVTVLKNGFLIDGTGAGPVAGSAVVIEEGRITDVGPTEALAWPQDAQVIDVAGKTIMPGFVDAHAHMIAYEYNLETRLTTPASLTALKSIANLRTTLEAGVTTVRDAGGSDLGIKLAVEQGLVPGPRLLICIAPLTQTGGLFDLHAASGATVDMNTMFGRVRHFCGGVEELRKITREFLLAGADVIKICVTGSVFRKPPGTRPAPQYTPEEIRAVVYEAKAAGKRTMTHCEGGPGLRHAVEAGIDSIDHGFFLTDEDVELMLRHGTYLVPTLAAVHGILKVIERNPNAAINPQSVQVARELVVHHNESIGKAIKAGVKIAMGSDAFGHDQGENLFELELMVRAGMTPMQAIVAGTQTASELLDVAGDLGTIACGKIADILVVDGNPLDDITLLQQRQNLAVIMKAGQLFKNQLHSAASDGAPDA